MDALSIGPSTGVAFFLMMATTWVVNLLKRLLTKVHGQHLGVNWDTAVSRIPGESWIVLAIGIPVLACLTMRLDLVASITGTALSGVPTWMAQAASGALVGMGAQKTFDATKAARSLATKAGI
jgi:hypothetical protein